MARKIKVWLVTWVRADGRIDSDEEIVSILSARLGVKTVAEYVERLYVDTLFLSSRLSIARNPKGNPHPARIERGKIDCGHNPILMARLVKEVEVREDEDGNERLSYSEIDES